MRRNALVTIVLGAAALLAPAPAISATNEIKLCGKPRGGWEVGAGNLDPRYPETRCSYAIAAYRKAKARPGDLTRLPRRFTLTVQAKRLPCKAKSSPDYAEFRCENANHFVLAYSFR